MNILSECSQRVFLQSDSGIFLTQIRELCPEEDCCPRLSVPKPGSRGGTPVAEGTHEEDVVAPPPAKKSRHCGTCREEQQVMSKRGALSTSCCNHSLDFSFFTYFCSRSGGAHTSLLPLILR